MRSKSTKHVHIISANQELRSFITETLRSMNLKLYTYDSEDDFLSRLEKLEFCDLVIHEVKDLYVYDMRIVKQVKRLSLGVSILLITSYRYTRIALERNEEKVSNYAVNHREEKRFLQTVSRTLDAFDYSISDKFAQLNEEEKMILELIVEDHTNKEIAKLMKCPTKTIECHRLQIVKKLEIPNKVTPKLRYEYNSLIKWA